MSTEQQRKILEVAAKACGLTYLMTGEVCDLEQGNYHWNPLTNPADTAEMCAKLEIDWLNKREWVVCRTTTDHGYVVKTDAQKIEDHDNSRLKAWMYATTMAAAKIGGYNEP